MNAATKDGASKTITTPVTAAKARELRAGEVVFLSGTVMTARDATHEYLLDEQRALPQSVVAALKHKVIFHCGPIVKQDPSGWVVKAAGPTTSARMNAVQAKVMQKYDIHAIIGKAGMQNVDWQKLDACYLAFVGGAAVLAKNAVTRVVDVAWLNELGMTEAAWVFQVEHFGPLIVAQDAHGSDLYADVLKKAARQAK
nr:FumA C-terminus/TtdB family hydratase beta subunit [Candidatus Sigynarchaeota archaeon]